MTYMPMRRYRLERFVGCTQGSLGYFNVVDEATGRVVGSAEMLAGGVMRVTIGVGYHSSTYYVEVPRSYYMPRYIYLP